MPVFQLEVVQVDPQFVGKRFNSSKKNRVAS